MTEYEWQRMQDDLEGGGICLAALEEILSANSADSVRELARTLYKYTECGAQLSVQLHDGSWRHSDSLDGVRNGDVRTLLVGSIVENSEAEVTGTPIDLLRCDTEGSACEAFNREVAFVDEEACRLWNEAHEEEEES